MSEQLSRLGEHMTTLGPDLMDRAQLMWQRSLDWVKTSPERSDGERGGGVGSAKTENTREDQAGDRAASLYHDELRTLTARLTSDLHRMNRLMGIICPDQPRQLQNRDLATAQVVAEGWCGSCWRDNGHLEPVWQGRYRDACRFCGEWRSTNETSPPLAVVRWRHRHPGKRVPLSIVEKAS